MLRNLPTDGHDGGVPYFSAVVAADGRSWRARDVDVADAGSLEDLADQLRAAAVGERPVLAVLEHEDEWFALVRVDGDADPRVFVSDMAAAERSRFGDMLATAADVEVADAVDDAAARAASDADPTDGAATATDPITDRATDRPADLATDHAAGPAPSVGDPTDPREAAAGDAAEDAAGDDADLLGTLAADLDDAAAEPAGLAAWAGETDLLDDLGLDGGSLRTLVEDNGDDPATVLGEIGEACGFDDLLEALR